MCESDRESDRDRERERVSGRDPWRVLAEPLVPLLLPPVEVHQHLPAREGQEADGGAEPRAIPATPNANVSNRVFLISGLVRTSGPLFHLNCVLTAMGIISKRHTGRKIYGVTAPLTLMESARGDPRPRPSTSWLLAFNPPRTLAPCITCPARPSPFPPPIPPRPPPAPPLNAPTRHSNRQHAFQPCPRHLSRSLRPARSLRFDQCRFDQSPGRCSKRAFRRPGGGRLLGTPGSYQGQRRVPGLGLQG